jgi:hypothetical protein
MIGVSPPAQGTLAQAQRLRWVRGPTDRHAPHRRGARASPTPSGGARRWSCWRCTVTRCARCPTRSASSRRSRAARCASSRGTTTRSTPCSAPRQTPRLSWRSAASLLRRTNWTRLVPPPVLTGHVSSLRRLPPARCAPASGALRPCERRAASCARHAQPARPQTLRRRYEAHDMAATQRAHPAVFGVPAAPAARAAVEFSAFLASPPRGAAGVEGAASQRSGGRAAGTPLLLDGHAGESCCAAPRHPQVPRLRAGRGAGADRGRRRRRGGGGARRGPRGGARFREDRPAGEAGPRAAGAPRALGAGVEGGAGSGARG